MTKKQKKSLYRILAGAAALLLALCMTALLAACGEDPNDEKKLSVVMTGTVRTMDPAKVSTAAERTVVQHVFENLMRLNADGTAAHAMARSYTQETALDGSVTYTFQLRTDAKWSDGTTVTAQLIAFRLVLDHLGEAAHLALRFRKAGVAVFQQGLQVGYGLFHALHGCAKFGNGRIEVGHGHVQLEVDRIGGLQLLLEHLYDHILSHIQNEVSNLIYKYRHFYLDMQI